MEKKVLAVLIGLTFVLLIAGCTSAPEGNTVAQVSKQVKDVKIDSFNFGFNQTEVRLQKGEKVRLTLTSSSGVHGLAIPGLGVSIGPVGPGESKVAEFEASASGTYEYFCNVPCGAGHKSMKGIIIVE